MLQINNLHKSFGSNVVLNGLNVRFDQKGIYAVLGPNGSGKTTLIKSILGMVKPQRGDIIIERTRDVMNQRILVAEDDPHTRSALAEVLRSEGYEVTEAADGLHAKDLFDQSPPDIACLDVMMPGISGYDVCKYFRSQATTMPILFITAKAEEIDKVVGLELGGDDYIVKPFGTKEVIARIRAVARRCFTESDGLSDSEFPDGAFFRSPPIGTPIR